MIVIADEMGGDLLALGAAHRGRTGFLTAVAAGNKLRFFYCQLTFIFHSGSILSYRSTPLFPRVLFLDVRTA